MKTILVTGAGGIVGYGILKSLTNTGYRLIGSTIYNNTIADYFSDISLLAIKTKEENYIDWLISTIKKYNVDLLIPSIEEDMQLWNNNRKIIEETGAIPLLNNKTLISLCEDKWSFYLKLKEHLPQYSIPSSLSNNFNDIKNILGNEIIIKPKKGFGSKGIIKNPSSLAFYIDETLMTQKLIGNDEEEYTVSAFFNSESKLCSYMSLKRKLSNQGFTQEACTCTIPNIEEILTSLASVFKPYGPTNFQFRFDKEQIKLIEINPRISSATSIRTKFGYNESLMSINYFLYGIEPTQPFIRTGRAIRYTEDHIYYD